MVERSAGLEAALVYDLALYFASESLRKTLAVILRADMSSVPRGKFKSRWAVAESVLTPDLPTHNPLYFYYGHVAWCETCD